MESAYLQSLLEWIAQHKILAGAVAFLVAGGESLAIVGLFVPGFAMMLAFGALIALGILDFWWIVICATLGAIAGDAISFWIGRHFKEPLRALWPFSRYPNLLTQGETFFLRHGGKSIFFGRFLGPLRAIIPTTAGMLEMSPAQFTLFNVLSALVWAPSLLTLGMLFGTSLDLASQLLSPQMLGMLGLLLVLLFITWSSHRSYLLSRWGARHPHLAPIITLLATLLLALGIWWSIKTYGDCGDQACWDSIEPLHNLINGQDNG